MLRGLYSITTGLDASVDRQAVVSENVAHANVPGYRRRMVALETFESAFDSLSNSPQPTAAGMGTRSDGITYDFTPGPVEVTGRTLDVAINGDGFFALDGPEGVVYTRNGGFQLDKDGNLVSATEMPVRGRGGPVSIPDQVDPAKITITHDGVLQAGEIRIGQLELVNFDDPTQLEAVGTTLFKATDGLNPRPDNSITVRQGVRERSNVNVVTELVNLITISREYQASANAMQALSEAIKQNSTLQSG